MNYQFKKLINFCLKLILCHLSISQNLKVFHFKNNKKKRISIEKNKNFWSASSAEKTTFSQKAQLPQKPAFHPSLGAHCRPATPGFQSGLQARSCAEAHTKKRRVLRKQKPQHAKHASIRAASPAVRGSAHENCIKITRIFKKNCKKADKSAQKIAFVQKTVQNLPVKK